MAISGAIDWFALIVSVAVIIKILFIIFKPGKWIDSVAKPIWRNPKATGIVSFILALIVLYYILQYFTIVEIMAVVLFISLLSAATIASFSSEFLKLSDKLVKQKDLIKKTWPGILIWVILAVWALFELLF